MPEAKYNPPTGGGGGAPTGPAGGGLAGTYPDPTVAAGSLDHAELAPTDTGSDPEVGGILFTIRKAFAAGAGGAPDDVSIFVDNAPEVINVIDAIWRVDTSVALETLQLRTASGGGGAPLSDAVLATTTGTKRDTARVNDVNPFISLAGSLYVRRSDSGIGGAVTIICQRIIDPT